MRTLAAFIGTAIVALATALALVSPPISAQQATPPPDLRSLRGVVARDGGFDAYWSITNYANQTYTVLRTGFDAAGSLQSASVPLKGNCQASAFAGRGDLPLAVSDRQLCAASAMQLEVLQDLLAPGSPTTIACGRSRCLAIWSSPVKLAQWFDIFGKPIGPVFTVPPAARLYPVVVNDQGALLIRLTGGELRATCIDPAGGVRFDQQLARGVLDSPSVAADDDGDQFVVAWADFSPRTSSSNSATVETTPSCSATVHFTTIAWDGTLNTVARLESALCASSPFDNLGLVWTGRNHLAVIPELRIPYPVLRFVRLDRSLDIDNRQELGTLQVATTYIPIRTASSGDAVAVAWSFDTPMFATVSATGAISTPVRLDPPPARRRVTR